MSTSKYIALAMIILLGGFIGLLLLDMIVDFGCMPKKQVSIARTAIDQEINKDYTPPVTATGDPNFDPTKVKNKEGKPDQSTTTSGDSSC